MPDMACDPHQAENALARDGEFKSKAGVLRKRLGRPNVAAAKVAKAQELLRQGNGILKVGRLVGLGSGTVQRVKREMVS
jgi:hypothetical protein